MLNDAFGGIHLLQKGLDAAWTRNSVITNNIANVDTPGFKSSRVEFETALKRAMEAESGGFSTKRTRPEHFDFSGSTGKVKPTIVSNHNTTYRLDGNNVDIDYESVELARNTFWYYSMIEQISSEFAKLKTVISG
ncbi:MAG: flagellar basal body rod protein FlgB [Christensenellales bacterium]|jgi:flagellar basal-body rod protein FlgB